MAAESVRKQADATWVTDQWQGQDVATSITTWNVYSGQREVFGNGKFFDHLGVQLETAN